MMNAQESRSGAPGCHAGIVALLVAVLILPALAADESVLTGNEGYLYIRVNATQRQRISRFSFTNVDTNEKVTLRLKDFRPSGTSAWMSMAKAPAGRYFWSEYEVAFGAHIEESRDMDQMYRRNHPSSADDSFEIAKGVVNYVGDWTMRVQASGRRSVDHLVQYEKSTMERYFTEYQELAGVHQLYLSMMGKKAISLDELAKIMQSQSQ